MIAGKDGLVGVISAETAYYLERYLNVSELRVRARGRNPRVAQELLDLREVAMSYRPSLPSPETETVFEPVGAESERWLTAAQVADRMGISERRVTMACRDEEVDARKVGGRWFVSPQGLEDWVAARAARREDVA
ncbi:helix-turn-helix domain-containing protein [Nocardioides sp. CPCC 205120]|uniref:helix-turn-helix domain-containing protein n=1 Tax=Nocardioides sp. CPCC 205120 TaxID=3406462 RepID=UPI003B5100DA